MSPTPSVRSSRRHVVQFYGHDDELLAKSVSRYLTECHAEGAGLLLVATPGHTDAIVTQLSDAGIDPVKAVRDGRLLALDAEQTLAALLVDGWPDAALFERVIGGVLGDLRRRGGRSAIAAFGEMVALLWERGDRDAAARLEELWNDFMGRGDLSLFCAYPIDVCGADFRGATLHPVLCTHTHVLTSGSMFEQALERALDDVLGPDAVPARRRMDTEFPKEWAALPRAEGLVLWVHTHLPDQAEAILARARHLDAASLKAG